MKSSQIAAVISLSALGLLILISPTGSEEKKETKQPHRVESQPQPPPTTGAVPVYKPPLRGAPGGRLGGGTRGSEREVFVLSVLAPDHTGLTANDQPSLYWFISNVASSPVELTVVDPRAVKPVLDTLIAPPIQPGVHRIRLADYGVRLAPGVAYRWFVAVVPDSDHRSKDILAGGTIERVELPEGLRAKLAQAGKTDRPFLYAAAGFWYDAVAALSELIETTPDDPVFRGQRAALMAEVGLPDLAENQPKTRP